jgi:hypothetical protein
VKTAEVGRQCGEGVTELAVCLSTTYIFAIDINSLIDGPIDDVKLAVRGSSKEVSLGNTHD